MKLPQANKKNKGVAIFIAVITVSALLLIATSISNLSYKEQIISSSGRDSREAFYAADAGVQCALFYDLKGGPDPTDPFLFSSPAGIITDGSSSIVCDEGSGDEIAVYSDNSDFNDILNTFYFNVPETNSCAIVTVRKLLYYPLDPDDPDYSSFTAITTTIESSGYNNTCSQYHGVPTVDGGPRNIQRTIRVVY